jgi:3-dehydroquinate synthase
MDEVWFDTRRRTRTRYVVGHGTLELLGEWLTPGQRLIPMVVDSRAWELHGSAVTKTLSGSEVIALEVRAEEDKDLSVVQKFIATLVEYRIPRGHRIVGFGGGVACDVAGLLAMLYMRGMPYALVGTSLMAQVDAAIGGKVGCNAYSRKNLIGGFHHPELVLLEQSCLATLDDRHFRSGLAEAVKLGMILPELGILELIDQVESQNADVNELLVRRCVEGKLQLLSSDPYESHLDRALNLGHAVAHALEKADGSLLLHGEAVAIGLAATARYAVLAGLADEDVEDAVRSRLARLGLPATAAIDPVILQRRLDDIRDHRGGRLRLVVPVPGGTLVLDDGDTELLTRCVTAC